MNVKLFAAGALALAAVSALPVYALAGAKDYAFEPVTAEVKKGNGVTVAVRLVNKMTKKPVPDAVIFRSRIDMSPEGMERMDAPLKPVSAKEPGVYAFQTDLPMAGGWALKLMAKVQGEPDTVEGSVVIRARD